MVNLFQGNTSQFLGAVAVFLVIGLGGCAELEEKYSRRHVNFPEPIGGPQIGPADTSANLKPAGTQSLATDRSRDALVRPEYFYGSGQVVAQPLGRPGVTEDASGDTVSLNFVDTAILEVVDVVLGKTLGLNYVIDARVQGTVTARTSKPIPRTAVLPLLENILALNGAALVDSQGVFNIVPVAAVASLPKVIVTPSKYPQGQGIGTHIIPLKFASVASVQEVVSSQVSPGHQLAVDHVRNILIYTGPAQEAQAITEMVFVLDVDVLSGMSFALFPVQSTNAEDITAELEVLFTEDALGALNGVVRFLPIERLNAVLAIASRPAHLRHAGEWVARLDRADAGAGERVFVYYVKNSRAKDLVDVLNNVFEGSGQQDSQTVSRAAVAPGFEPVELIAPPLTPRDPEESFETGAAAAEAELDAATLRTGIRRTSSNEGIRFVADERNNAIVVVATTDQFRMVEAAIRRLDILPLQVLIEATIAEVSLNDELEYGLEWAFRSGRLSGESPGGIFNALSPAFPAFNVVLNATDATVALTALSKVTDLEVASSPQLMVLDNQTARLQVGDQVPIATQSSVASSNPDSPIVNSINYFDTGVILEVTPLVNAGGLVTLEISLEVSDAIPTETSEINSPTIQQRSIKTQVAVQSGETVALGGLIRERSTDTVSGIPLLQDIPVLGNLFKSTDQDSLRTELLVLITPRVVRGASQTREVTDELRKRLTTLRDVVLPGQ